jgi:hypothetical protein
MWRLGMSQRFVTDDLLALAVSAYFVGFATLPQSRTN